MIWKISHIHIFLFLKIMDFNSTLYKIRVKDKLIFLKNNLNNIKIQRIIWPPWNVMVGEQVFTCMILV
jgi:hypothetical protein